MEYEEFKYIDYAYGGVRNRNNVISIDELPPPEENIMDCFQTYFRFNSNYLNYFQENGSVKGYKGKCYADFLPIDIDNNNLDESYSTTKTLIELLYCEYDYDVEHIFFSGSKGFHILISSHSFGIFKPAENLPQTFKNIVSEITGGLPNIDTSIYNHNRLLRLNNTIHGKTKLYKIPITRVEFNSGLDTIKLLAKRPGDAVHIELDDFNKNSYFSDIYNKYVDTKSLIVSEGGKLNQDLETGVLRGERDVTAARICGILKSKEIGKQLANSILLGWNKGNIPPMDDDQVLKVVNSIYSYDNVEESDLMSNIRRISQVAEDYSSYVNNPDRVYLGISFLDDVFRGLRPGQVMTILGFTGNYKSALLQWLMRNYTKETSKPVLMFQMEMSSMDLFERSAQMATQMSAADIESDFKNKGESIVQNYIDQIEIEQSNFAVVDVPALNFDDMEKYITLAEEKFFSEKISLIGIDFIQLMTGQGKSNIERMDFIAKELKIFARKINIPIIAISQVTGKENEYSKIDLMDMRDSKTLAQMSDFSIGISLEEGTTDIQSIRVLKNRKGRKVKGRVKISRDTLSFTEL